MGSKDLFADCAKADEQGKAEQGCLLAHLAVGPNDLRYKDTIALLVSIVSLSAF